MGDEPDNSAKLVELPYRAEYAKTNRSTCKKCKQPIGQDALRISVREPSQFFDGMQDFWWDFSMKIFLRHHYKCFWTALKGGEINERSIRGFDWLKWEDQERIRASISEHDAATRPGSSNSGIGKDGVQMSMIKVEYAKTDRGKCHGCNLLVAKGVMKFGVKARFYHFECLFTPNGIYDGQPGQISGYNDLTKNDQEMLNDQIDQIVRVHQVEQDVAIATLIANGGTGTLLPTGQKRPAPVEKTEIDEKMDKLKIQTNLLWELRTGFKELFTKQQLNALREANFLDKPEAGGEDALLELLCDAALFGRSTRCPTCLTGQYMFSSTQQMYVCTGHLTEWTRCHESTRQPDRIPFGVPNEMGIAVPWLINEAPINKMKERLYIDHVGKVVSGAKAFRHLGARKSLCAEMESGHKSAASGKSFVKNGTTIDAEFTHAQVCHVVRDPDGSPYNAVLSSADLSSGRNSYYKLQLLKHDTKEKYYVFRSWGRIGTTQGGCVEDEFRSRHMAVDSFEIHFKDKSGNDWKDRKYFRKKAGFMNIVETDNSELVAETAVAPGSRSQLPRPIIDIMKMIFDVDNMKQALKEYDIDIEKMPLGKLSKSQITKAFVVLHELTELFNTANCEQKAKIIDASNRFYSIIPHNKLELLESLKRVQKKSVMLESLLEILEAYSMMNPKQQPEVVERDPVDTHYERLSCKMTVVDKDSDEYKRLVDYATKTHGQTHQQLKVEIIDILRLERSGEAERFRKDLGNRMLLWHGSGVPNYGGILSQGLRIAPPEAPVTGYMFGKGVYFADMFSKSANYCRAQTGEGLLLLADVALGKIHPEQNSVGHSAKTEPLFKSCAMTDMYKLSPYFSEADRQRVDPIPVLYSLPSYHDSPAASGPVENGCASSSGDHVKDLENAQMALIARLKQQGPSIEKLLQNLRIGPKVQPKASTTPKSEPKPAAAEEGKEKKSGKENKKEARKENKAKAVEAKGGNKPSAQPQKGASAKVDGATWIVKEEKPGAEIGQSLAANVDQGVSQFHAQHTGQLSLSMTPEDQPWVQILAKIAEQRGVLFVGAVRNNTATPKSTIAVAGKDTVTLGNGTYSIVGRISVWKALGALLGVSSFEATDAVHAAHTHQWLLKANQVLENTYFKETLMREASRFLSSRDSLGGHYAASIPDLVVFALISKLQNPPSNVELWRSRIKNIGV
ncbi:unnamed protein product, partial [Mesorhabditis spiculigera]